MTFEQIINKIQDIIDTKNSQLKVEFYGSEICFCIYEREVCISYILKENLLYFNCELTDGKLYIEELKEICEIMELLENNKEVLKNVCRKES